MDGLNGLYKAWDAFTNFWNNRIYYHISRMQWINRKY